MALSPLPLFPLYAHIGERAVHVHEDGRILPVIRGGAGEDDELAVPDDLTALDEDQARDLHARLEERFQARRAEASTPAQVAELRTIREAQARIGERVTAIHAERAEVAEGLAALDEAPALPDAPAADAAPVAATDTPPPAAEPPVGTPQAVAAAASPPVVLTAAGVAAARAPQTAAAQRPSDAPARPRATYVAAAGQTEVQQGQPLTVEQIGVMVDSAKFRMGTMRDGQSPVTAFIASLPAFEDAAGAFPVLSNNNSRAENDRMMREAVEDWRIRTNRPSARRANLGMPEGRTAAICDPLDIIREIPDCSTDADPFGDSLPQRPAGRLGFQFTGAIAMSAVDEGVTAGWGETAQADVDPEDRDTWKPCIDIGCPTPDDVRAAAVTACVTFDVTTEMSNPERVQDVMQKLAALRVRKRTVSLLNIADGLSSLYTFTTQFAWGAFPALIEASMSSLARLAYAERLDIGDYNIYLPPGLVEALATDLNGRAYANPEEAAQANASVVNMVETITGLRAVRLLDAVAGNPFAALNAPGEAAAALPQLDGVYPVRFIAPESALYFSTGEEKTGLEASPELLRQNKRQFFSEEYVGLAKHGCHPWLRVDMTLCPNGARAGLEEPVSC